MKLYTASDKDSRPVRLSEETRALAFEALSGRRGSEAMTHPWVSVDFVPEDEWEAMDVFDKHDLIIIKPCIYAKLSAYSVISHIKRHLDVVKHKAFGVYGISLFIGKEVSRRNTQSIRYI